MFDHVHNVLLTRVFGVYVKEDVILRDRQVARFVARNGLARGLMDFSDLAEVDIPMDYIVRRAQAAPVLPGQLRVIVAPGEPAYSLNRVVAAHQYFSRKVEPVLVGSLKDAYQVLGGSLFDFAPLEEDGAARRERTVLRVLAQIDEVRRSDDAGDRARMRQRMMHLLDTASERLSGGGPYEPHRLAQSAISMSDLLNTDLRFARVCDADLTMQCPHCSKESRLSACRIATGRKTTYSCPKCTGVLVVLAPGVERPSVQTTGYCIGGFEVQTEADISCRGAILPKS
jgi:hypothetical protein